MFILYFVFGFLAKNRNMVKLFKNNMEIKYSPLAPTLYIKYADLKKVVKGNEKRTSVY